MGIGNIATTGMQAAIINMETISNNIANANTYGFKSSSVNFADLFPTNGSSDQPGLGVTVPSILQNFNTGGSASTNVPSDLSITNSGFFIMQDATSGEISYTRYGRFSFDGGYFLQGNQRLQGFAAVNGVIPSGTSATDLVISTSPIAANPTSVVTQNGLNLDANDEVPVNSFSTSDTSSYNFSNPATVYDSLGNANSLVLYYIKSSANNWTVNAYVNGSSVGTGSLYFSNTGALSSTSGLGSLSFSPTSGAASPQDFAVDLTGATQTSAGDSVNLFTSDGYPVGAYTGYDIDKNGFVSVSYNNGQPPVLVGQIALATFQSPAGLQNIGNASWVATSSSGAAVVNQANSQSGLNPGSVELSNVDLTSEMVNLINAQNTFQANAQVEQAYNQVMQTVTKL